MISVAMALYNSTRFIEEQLDSIRTQTVPVDEVVMIDDCSADGTVNYVKDYISKYNLKNWKIERHERNRGYIDTFFDAIKGCSGNIVILCDHDDIWIQDKVNMIQRAFTETPEMLVLATGFERIDENGNVVPVKLKRGHSNNNLIRRAVNPNALNKMSLYDVAIYNISPGCTCAISSKIKEEFLGRRCALPHDWTLTILAACHDGLYYLDKPTTKYRIYDKNTIGLGHESNYEKRKKDVHSNFLEKQAMMSLISDYYDITSRKYKYCEKVTEVFTLRDQAMETGRIGKSFSALIRSGGLGHLYESSAMDLITLIRR